MFKVYSSSAGSGKTYTLTKEYLKLALGSDSETYFRSILAVTFTNAAASEMKERILTMLREFSKPEGVGHGMLLDIVRETYPGIEQDPDLFGNTCTLYSVRAQKVFRKILHRYSDFSVMTIDKFTQRLVSSFTDELGIPFAFETVLETDQLSQAVDRLLARIGQEGEHILTDVVETYYRESAESGKSWGSLPHKIREAAYDLLNEKSYLAMQTVADLDVQDWVGISRQIRAFILEHENGIVTLAKRAMEHIQEKHLAESDFARGSQGIHAYFEKKSKGLDLWKPGNSYVLAAIQEDKWCGGKATKFIQETVASITDVLTLLCREIEGILQQHQQKANVLAQIEKHLYNLSLLNEIRKEFDDLLRQGNQVHISDFNRKVLEIVAKEPVPFIFERLGEKYNHILVDEFQDTSKLQFANLLPLIDNALGFGHFNLIVGDAKQSIYRFRGGDMDLILHLSQNQVQHLASILGNSPFTQERLLGIDSYLTVDHLKTNRRSYREITDFNNSFFECVSKKAEAVPGMVGSVFDDNFKQEVTPDVKRHGHVQIEFLTQSDEAEATAEASSNVMIERTLQIVDELREKGYQWRDVAILCRKKSEAADIAGALKERGNPLISDDSLLLTYSQSVNLLVSFMQVLQTPDNALARYEAAYLYHRVILQQQPDASRQQEIQRMCAGRDLTTFLHYFESFGMEINAFQLRQLGVYELVEKLIALFDLFAGLTEGAYLFRFMDAVMEFSTRRSNHLADFLTYWETARNKISITVPANADALRITTIHKSKGLEYPVVIVPNAHWKFMPNGARDRIWVDLEKVQETELVYERLDQEAGLIRRRLNSSVVSMVSALEQTPLKDSYDDERTRTLLENLNLMYVAFTRPVQRLYVLAKGARDWDKCRDSVNKWLYEYLNSEHSPVKWEETRSTYVVWEGNGDCYHNHRKSNGVSYPVRQVISTDRADRLRLRRLAERIFDVETFEKRNDHRQKMRYALSLIRDVGQIASVVQKICTEGILDQAQASALQSDLHTLCQQDELRDLFEVGVEVKLNREFLRPGGKSVLVDRQIRLSDARYVLMNTVAGMGNDDARRKLRRAMHAFGELENTKCKGVLLALGHGKVEWLD
jgi:ATP-dependent helicase/nuclease subunit A